MGLVGAVGSVALILFVLVDAFEAVVLPRRVTHPFRLARVFYRITWSLWRVLALRVTAGKHREATLSWFGPLSLLGLFATWASGLIVGFALLYWSLGSALQAPEGQATLATHLYLSGVTFFTLGYGDVYATTAAGRFLAVIEAGMGFGFMALIIGYLPALYQAFSAREMAITLLDARAGSPPSAAQVLVRLARAGNLAAIDPFLAEWERWSAVLLESHLSFPVLGYYRSQHDNQSWLSALTAVLDTCALLLAEGKELCLYQAELTFAMARHAAVDLALVLKVRPLTPPLDRLSGDQWQRLRQQLMAVGLELHDGPIVAEKLAELRQTYESFVYALGQHFLLALPEVLLETPTADNWQRSAWMRRPPGIGSLSVAEDWKDWHE